MSWNRVMGPRAAASSDVRLKTFKRDRWRCQAEWLGEGGPVGCVAVATDLHHMLSRSRGGTLLDMVRETYHLVALCHTCHMRVHQSGDPARRASDHVMLTIDGSVLTDRMTGRPSYTGTDSTLRERYP